RLGEATGAAAADMESHIAARAAANAGLPLAVLRVIADPAERALPQAATAGLGADGGYNPAAVLRRLAGHPPQIVALGAGAIDAHRARGVLRAAGRQLPPRFALGDDSGGEPPGPT